MYVPRPIVSVHGEDVDVEVPRLLNLRATFLSEGLFDEQSGGDPDAEDLYEVEVTHHRDAILQPIVFPRLMPATSRAFPDEDTLLEMDLESDEAADTLPIERFLILLAWELANAHTDNWDQVCEAARGWDTWMIEDALHRLPPDWTPEPLIPDLD